MVGGFKWKNACAPLKKDESIHACSSNAAALQGWESGGDRAAGVRRALREDQRSCAQKTRKSAPTTIMKSTVPLVSPAATKKCHLGLRATTKAISHVETAPHTWSAPSPSPFSSECPGGSFAPLRADPSRMSCRAEEQLSQQCCQSETAALTELQRVTAFLGSLSRDLNHDAFKGCGNRINFH